MTTVYATPAQYTAQTGLPAPEGISRILRLASLDVDMELLAALYDPTDTAVLAVLQEATIEQAAALESEGADQGTPTSLTSASVGPVSLSYGSATSNSRRTVALRPRALAVLNLAGMTGHGPDTGL